ncbi:ribose-phosphate diphosphokinase [Candidatus Woesearchaeota archaeon]|nr:ribose-phosphate diphosphokinase [Candidatus Woesearchaeota archaeon]
MEHELCIFSCRASSQFAERAVKELATVFEKHKKLVKNSAIKMGSITTKTFRDGELYQRLDENVRGGDVFVFQSLQSPGEQSVNENLMELLLLNGVIRLSSAFRITNVIAYHAYARQDRKTKGREGISAKQVAKLLQASGADRILTMDLHSGQIQGFYDIPVDNLTALPVLGQHAAAHHKRNGLVVVSPDAGGVERAKRFADMLGATLAIINKHRPQQGEAEIIGLVGDVAGKDVIILDDIVDSGGTVQEAVAALRKSGAKEISIYCSHPLFSEPAPERLTKLGVAVIGTDTILHNDKFLGQHKWFTQLSVAHIFAEAIFNIHTNRSVSQLLDELHQKS